MKLDILVLASHPDDAELGCGGTIAKHTSLGYKVGIIDFTKGELGTRGTIESRAKEADEAARIQGVAVRENLGFKDGFFQNDPEHQMAVIRVIRKYQPSVILANATYDRHVDHGKGANLAYDASFLSGLVKIETFNELGNPQQVWRPQAVYHYIQSYSSEPDFIIDVTDFWEVKMRAIKAFKTQFFDPANTEPETYISKPGFLKMVEARGIEHGHAIEVAYGEGFTTRKPLGVKKVFDIF